jgi:hypothetical protein
MPEGVPSTVDPAIDPAPGVKLAPDCPAAFAKLVKNLLIPSPNLAY